MTDSVTYVKMMMERAVKSAAQGALVALGGTQIYNFNLAEWKPVAFAAASMFIASILTSIASVSVGQPGTPSLVKYATPQVVKPSTTPVPADSTPGAAGVQPPLPPSAYLQK